MSIKVFENYLVDKEPVEGEGLFVDDVFHADVTSATSGSGISAWHSATYRPVLTDAGFLKKNNQYLV